MRRPRSTYRWQITPERTLTDAAADIGYLHRLGADAVYLSPLLQSTSGSDHGYDVVDHARTDAARGGLAGLAALSAAAHDRGMGVLVDIVPNHVGVQRPIESVWWWDVLARGRESVHAAAFDIEWDAGGGRLRIPVLGDGGDDELDALRIDGDQLCYYEHRYPIADGTAGGSPRQVHERQHYELIGWRRADTDLNYRRFFAVSTLAAVRVEDRRVFDDSHTEIRRWVDEGLVDGLRVDHPDGLADPGGYLERLSELAGGRYLLVEKILEPGEVLPPSWRCEGTTGYDALAVIDRLFVDPQGEQPLDRLDTALRGSAMDWPTMLHRCKREVADGILGSEVRRLARLVPQIDRADDAIAELLSSFAVYRSYLPYGREQLDDALRAAVDRRPELAETLVLVGQQLTEADGELSTRFQQTSGMVMAKGVEDCAFYRWSRLTSLTEVGGDPADFAVSPDQFHAEQQRRLTASDTSMTTLSTHDTKRGEDVRARITVLAECPQQWATAVHRWRGLLPLPDGPLANLLLQAAVGAWPIERDRLHGYAEKAAREAGSSTGWERQDAGFERQLHAMVDGLYDHQQVATELAAFAADITPHGWSNSLSAKLVQLTVPGVPDVYQGTEVWQNSLVDPDNRRPVDTELLAGMLRVIDAGALPPVDATGAAKLLVTARALRCRRDSPELFTGYTPLSATGSAAAHSVAFDRGGVVTVATRLPRRLAVGGGWADTRLQLPDGQWTDLLTGRPATDELTGLLQHYPVALLVRAGHGQE